MTVKEKIIRQSIAAAEKELEEVEKILSASPLSRICQIRIEAKEILDKCQNDNAKASKLIEPLAVEEQRCFALANRQQKESSKLWERKTELTIELGDLKEELFLVVGKKV